jgi:hypothetical protein
VSALTLDTDFDARRIVTGTVSLRPYGYADRRADAARFFDHLRERLRLNPDIEAVSFIERQVRWESGASPRSMVLGGSSRPTSGTDDRNYERGFASASSFTPAAWLTEPRIMRP